MLHKTFNPPQLLPLAGVGAMARVRELQEASAPNTRPTQTAPARVATRRPTAMTRAMDDYSILRTSDGTAWVVCGLKLSTDILTFSSREEATLRGKELARAARVSLWYDPTSHHRDALLVTSFREEKR